MHYLIHFLEFGTSPFVYYYPNICPLVYHFMLNMNARCVINFLLLLYLLLIYESNLLLIVFCWNWVPCTSHTTCMHTVMAKYPVSNVKHLLSLLDSLMMICIIYNKSCSCQLLVYYNYVLSTTSILTKWISASIAASTYNLYPNQHCLSNLIEHWTWSWIGVLHHIYICTKVWLLPWYSNKMLHYNHFHLLLL